MCGKVNTFIFQNSFMPQKFSPKEIPLDTLEKFGMTEEKLKQTGNYDKLLNGERTSLIYSNTFDGHTARFEQGKLALIRNNEGKVILMYDGVKSLQSFPNELKGYRFSKEDKEDLLKMGHLGKPVDMIDKNGKLAPNFVSIDKETNTIMRWNVSKFQAPETILGVPVSKDNQELLKQGKPIFISGLKDRAGQEFSSYIIADAINKKLAFVSKSNMLDKFLAPEHKSQVQRNNQGLSTEDNKNTKGTLKSKGTGKEDTAQKAEKQRNTQQKPKGKGL